MAERKRIRGKCYSLSGKTKTKADAMKKARQYTREGQNVNIKKINMYEVWVEC